MQGVYRVQGSFQRFSGAATKNVQVHEVIYPPLQGLPLVRVKGKSNLTMNHRFGTAYCGTALEFPKREAKTPKRVLSISGRLMGAELCAELAQSLDRHVVSLENIWGTIPPTRDPNGKRKVNLASNGTSSLALEAVVGMVGLTPVPSPLPRTHILPTYPRR